MSAKVRPLGKNLGIRTVIVKNYCRTEKANSRGHPNVTGERAEVASADSSDLLYSVDS